MSSGTVGPRKISIQLVQHEDELVVTVEDNGSGFDASALYSSEGNGWKNINSALDSFAVR